MNRWMKTALLAVMMGLLIVLAPAPALGGSSTIYGVGVALAALAAVLIGAAQKQKGVDTLDLALCCVPGAFVGARLLYVLFRLDFYLAEMGPLHILTTWEGGFLLYGAVFGAVLSAAALAKRGGVSVAETLDRLAVPGLAAIAVSRLFECTVGEGLGAWVENESLCFFPLAVQNEYGEWQLAVFLFEAVAALVMLLIVRRMKPQRAGERMLSALLMYAVCQVLLESLRMDGCLKIGFVRVSQVLSAVVILTVTVLHAMGRGGRKAAIQRVLIFALCAGGVGGIEWALDKTPISNLLLYVVMAAFCAAMYVNGRRKTA